MGKTLERNVLYRAASQAVRKAGVVNDAPVANVDAVMIV
jgi:hypothetical protein